ncbi:hypothetical protein CVT26_013725 [Gymnopilus dilepis]|uniref:Smr domain-containing protein n=1 Tax=Gymnopilus dilepis TaxID=231916 RepID=A0A409YWP5_9AGAR|nr:hypothetical protein CVT26_013725 [Gymnopilus dilepis]
MSFVRFLKAVFALFCGPQQPAQAPDYPLSPAKHEGVSEDYASLRAQANEHGSQMAKCFQQSHEAYARGDGALAKDLSNQGKEHQRRMQELNKQASDYIFSSTDAPPLRLDTEPGEVDLHGLYVKEAISRADEAIQIAKRSGQKEIRFIVGKGLHSHDGVAKIKPAIEDLMQKHRLLAELDPHNSGVLIVKIDSEGRERGIGPEEISRRLEREEESCTIM